MLRALTMVSYGFLLHSRSRLRRMASVTAPSKEPRPGDLRLIAVRRCPCGSIFHKQGAPIQNPGREQLEADVWQPCKGGLNAGLRENQGADDEFETIHQSSCEKLLNQRHAPQGSQLRTVSPFQFTHKAHHI